MGTDLDRTFAALVGALSRATDLAMGQPMGHAVRSCLFALRLAVRVKLPKGAREETFWVGLLSHSGCTAGLELSHKLFGDEVASRAWFYSVDHGNPREVMSALFRNLGKDLPLVPRLLTQVRAVAGMPGLLGSAQATCETARNLSRSFGLPPAVVDAIGKAYERPDGRGFPDKLKGEAVPVSVRLVNIGQLAVAAREHDPEGWTGLLARRSGGQLDAALVAAVGTGREAEALFETGHPTEWEALLAEAPRLAGVDEDRLERVLEGFADMADLLIPGFTGHSRAVARMAGEALARLGRPAAEIAAARRAGLVHDIGRAGISIGIWGKPARLDDAEKERMRLHAYQTRRILDGVPGFEAVARAAGSTHERLDGGGYPMGSKDLDLVACAVAAADIAAALTEPRAHRPAFPADEAARLLAAEAEARRLDPAVVRALIDAMGQRAPVSAWPDGLTDREVEVLCVAAQGLTNKEIAARLGLTPKTVGNHLQNVFPKIGVTTRAAAALYAMQKDLLRFVVPR